MDWFCIQGKQAVSQDVKIWHSKLALDSAKGNNL